MLATPCESMTLETNRGECSHSRSGLTGTESEMNRTSKGQNRNLPAVAQRTRAAERRGVRRTCSNVNDLIMTKRIALATSGVLLLAVSFELATTSAAEIAWGDAVNGLRAGVSIPDGSLPSEQRPMFTVVIQNISRRPLWIPSPTAFVPAKHPRVDAFFQRPF